MTGFTTLQVPPAPPPRRNASGRLAGAPCPARAASRGALFQNLVDEPVADRFLPVHEVVPVGVLLDPFDALTGVLGEDFVQPVPGLEHLLGLDLHVRGLTLKAAGGLMDHDPGVRQAVAL